MPRKKVHQIRIAKIKIRKRWHRNPASRIIPIEKDRRITKRELENEAVQDYDDMK